MYVKNLVIEDNIVIGNAFKMHCTLVTENGDYNVTEWLDKDYKICRDGSSDMMKPGYTQIKDLLKDTKMYVSRLMDGLDAGIALQRILGKELSAARWCAIFDNTRKR